MERAELVFLEQAVNDLCPNIILVIAEDVTVNELLGTGSEVVFVVQEAVPAAGDEMKPASQGIVDLFMGVACRVDDLFQL